MGSNQHSTFAAAINPMEFVSRKIWRPKNFSSSKQRHLTKTSDLSKYLCQMIHLPQGSNELTFSLIRSNYKYLWFTQRTQKMHYNPEFFTNKSKRKDFCQTPVQLSQKLISNRILFKPRSGTFGMHRSFLCHLLTAFKFCTIFLWIFRETKNIPKKHTRIRL